MAMRWPKYRRPSSTTQRCQTRTSASQPCGVGTPAEGIEELTIEYLRDKILAELGDENDLAAEREVPDYDPEPEVDDEGGMSEVYGSPTGRLPAPYGSIQEPQEQSFRPLDPEIFPDGGYTA